MPPFAIEEQVLERRVGRASPYDFRFAPRMSFPHGNAWMVKHITPPPRSPVHALVTAGGAGLLGTPPLRSTFPEAARWGSTMIRQGHKVRRTTRRGRRMSVDFSMDQNMLGSQFVALDLKTSLTDHLSVTTEGTTMKRRADPSDHVFDEVAVTMQYTSHDKVTTATIHPMQPKQWKIAHSTRTAVGTNRVYVGATLEGGKGAAVKPSVMVAITQQQRPQPEAPRTPVPQPARDEQFRQFPIPDMSPAPLPVPSVPRRSTVFTRISPASFSSSVVKAFRFGSLAARAKYAWAAPLGGRASVSAGAELCPSINTRVNVGVDTAEGLRGALMAEVVPRLWVAGGVRLPIPGLGPSRRQLASPAASIVAREGYRAGGGFMSLTYGTPDAFTGMY